MMQRINPLALRYALNPWTIFGLALLLRLAAFYLYYFVYKTPGSVPPSPLGNDSYDYLGRELLSGDISDWNFAYRPPLYPMFIAAVYGLSGMFNPLVVVVAQIVLSASMCLFAYRLAHELGVGQAVPAIAALLTAIDPASIAIAQTFMAETLTNFFIAFSLIFLARLLKDGRLRDAAACGAAIALATLARPNPLYFVAIVVVALVWLLPRWPTRAAVVIAVFAVGVGPWFARNYAYHRLFTFTTNANFNLLFYKAVSVEYWATGKSPEVIEADFAYEVEKRLGVAQARETYDANAIWRHLVPTDSRTDGILREIALEVYLAHPHIYLMLFPVTLVKLLTFTEGYAGFGLLRWADFAFNVILSGSALVGCIIICRQKRWIWSVTLIAPIVYYLAVPAVAGGVQDTRARTNVTICFAILSGLALVWLWRLWRDRRPSTLAPNDFSRP